jgi:glucose/mannose-6-phosphate isomerase
LEALANPTKVASSSIFVFLFSKNYNPRIIKRFQATKKVLDKQGIKSFVIIASGQDALNQSLSVLAQGSWLSFYLAMLNGVNPAEIPWVNYFKKELDK